MQIKDFAGFQLDTSKIELHSIHERDILLPYSGPLPASIQDNDGAAVSVILSVGLSVKIGLVITNGKKQHRYPVEATAQGVLLGFHGPVGVLVRYLLLEVRHLLH